MVRMVYSVYLGAIRIRRGLLPVVETASGKSSSSLSWFCEEFVINYSYFEHYIYRYNMNLYCVDNSIIRTIDGKILHKYKHPAAVFGCDWSQNNK